MPFAVNIAPNGLSLGHIPAVHGGGERQRGFVAGWSERSSRSNLRFLQSIQLDRLGPSWGATLTVGGDVPCFHAWAKMRRRFLDWLGVRYQPVATYWLMEFQRRGAPHLHVWCIVNPARPDHANLLRVLSQWLENAKETGVLERGQHIAPIDPRIAWARYLAKHMARGRRHYQRDALPDGWKVTGRVWGKSGDWPVSADRFDVEDAAAFRLRRALRRYVGKRHAAAGARVCEASQSYVRGASLWLSDRAARRLLAWAVGQGETVSDVGEVVAGADVGRVGVWLGGLLVPRGRYAR